MSSSATATQGVQLRRGDGGGSEVFTLIGLVTSINGPSETTTMIDVTSFDSTAREFISDLLPDGGEVVFEVNYASGNAQQAGLRTDQAAGTVRNFELELNDGTSTNTVISFAAIVTNWAPSFAVADKVTASCTLKVSGAVTYTLAT